MKKLLISFFVLVISLNIFSQNGRNGPSLWEEIRDNSKLNYDNTKPQITEALKKYNSHQYLTRDLLNTELGLDYLSRSGDMQISRLRLKLKKECNLKDIIRSVHGKGYKIFI